MSGAPGTRTRSRSGARPSSSRPGWAPLRKDAPGRKRRTRGSFPDLSTPEARQAALAAVDADVYAASSKAPTDSRLRFVNKTLHLYGMTPYPPTREKVRTLGAALKAGGYTSAANYLSAYRVEAERQGFHLDGPFDRAMADYRRSCERGLGAPVKSRALPFERLRFLPGGRKPWTPKGPVCPRNALVLGSWFLTREVELACSRAVLVRVHTEGRASVEWHLPASKADTRAEGVARTHFCTCTPSDRGRPDCPACVMHAHLATLRKMFAGHLIDGKFPKDFPLFPDARGRPCSKEAMAAAFLHAADLLGVEHESPDGSEAITGHTLRVTGAQGLARMGLDLWAIQLIGRWGSSAVQGYVRAIPLERAVAWASLAARNWELPNLCRGAAEQEAIRPGWAERVIADAASQTPPEWGDTVRALVKPLEVELVVASPLPDLKCWVRNPAAPAEERLFHLALLPLHGTPLGSWRTRCGWRFGGCRTVVVDHPAPEPPDWKSVCLRCAREVHLELKGIILAALPPEE